MSAGEMAVSKAQFLPRANGDEERATSEPPAGVGLAGLPAEALAEILAALLLQEPRAADARMCAARVCRVSRRLRLFAGRFLVCRLPWLCIPERTVACGCARTNAVCRRCLQGADCGDCEECAARMIACEVCGTTKLACCRSFAAAPCSRCAQSACPDCISECDSDRLLSRLGAKGCACTCIGGAVVCKSCCNTNDCTVCGIQICVYAQRQVFDTGFMMMDTCHLCGMRACLSCQREDVEYGGAKICDNCALYEEERVWLHGEAQYQAYLYST